MISDDSWKLDDATVLKSFSFWVNNAHRALQENVFRKLNRNEAKNVIFFIGDGMSIPTVTASRIYDGQVKGIVGERNTLFMERFPYVGLSKVGANNSLYLNI